MRGNKQPGLMIRQLPTLILVILILAAGCSYGGSESSSSKLYAYMNGTEFVLMRADQVVAKKTGSFTGYGPAWTLDHRYVATLEGDDYTASTHTLAVMDTSNGTIRNLPCSGCRSIVGIGGSQLAAVTEKLNSSRMLVRFDLSSSVPPVEVPIQVRQATRVWLVAGTTNQVLVASTTGLDVDDKLFVMNLDGSSPAAWTINGEIVAAAASSPNTQQTNIFAIHYRRMLPGCELGDSGSVEWVDLVSLIDVPNGRITKTDASNVISEMQTSHPERTDVGKTRVASIWWSIDGHLYASMRAWPCEAYLSPEIAKTIESFAVWRLEGKQWEQAEGEAALAVHPLGEDSRAILTQSTADGYLGTLYLESGDKRTRVAEDVTLSVPTPTR